MTLYFSGVCLSGHSPETILAEYDPGVMLTYWELSSLGRDGTTEKRFTKHRKRLRKQHAKNKQREVSPGP